MPSDWTCCAPACVAPGKSDGGSFVGSVLALVLVLDDAVVLDEDELV